MICSTSYSSDLFLYHIYILYIYMHAYNSSLVGPLAELVLFFSRNKDNPLFLQIVWARFPHDRQEGRERGWHKWYEKSCPRIVYTESGKRNLRSYIQSIQSIQPLPLAYMKSGDAHHTFANPIRDSEVNPVASQQSKMSKSTRIYAWHGGKCGFLGGTHTHTYIKSNSFYLSVHLCMGEGINHEVTRTTWGAFTCSI